MNQLYFFSQDDSCHWYIIPVHLRERWNYLHQCAQSNHEDTAEKYNDMINDEFGQYRTGGGIDNIEFYLPEKN